MASGVYNIWKTEQGGSTGPQWASTFVFRAMLIQSSNYTFDQDANFISSGSGDLVLNECTGSGYTTGAGYQGAGRITLATQTIAVDDTNNRAVCDTTDIVWASIDVSQSSADQVGVAVIAEVGTSDDTSIPVAYFDSTTMSTAAGGLTTNGGDLTVTWSTSGVLTLT